MRHARILFAGAELAALADAIDSLSGDGTTLRTCDDPQDVPSQVASFRPDLVVLDVPSGDPELVGTIVRRTHASYRPLLLCVLADDRHELPALEAGADACAHRPFTGHDLGVHIDALLRRTPWLDRSVHQVGGLVVDEDAAIALFDGAEVSLTAKDFGLLAHLVRNAGTVLSKRALLEALWDGAACDENLVEVHVSAVRRQLPPAARALIHTVRGLGYVARDDGAQEQPA